MMVYNSPASNSFGLISLFTVSSSLLPFYVKLEQLKRHLMTEMKDGVPKQSLMIFSKNLNV